MPEVEKKAGIWPGLVAVIGLSFLAVTGWSIYRAVNDVSKVTDPAYYSHGLRYNQTRIEERAAEAMGWRLATAIREDRLVLNLESGQAEPVTGCRGEISIFTGDKRLILTLAEREAGLYWTKLPPSLTGSLTGELTLQRNGARFNRRLLLNL